MLVLPGPERFDRRMRPVLAIALAVAAAALVSACGGGGEELSRGDAAFADRMRGEIAETGLLLAAVNDCGDDVACMRRQGGPLADRAGYAAQALADDVPGLDDPCLRDLGEPLIGYLQAAGDVGIAAKAGDLDSVALRTDRASEQRRTIQDRIVACVPGAADDPRLSAARELGAAFDDLLPSIDRLDRCRTAECLIGAGSAIRAAAEASRARLAKVDAGRLPACYREALAAADRALGAYARGGTALNALDPDRALVAFRRGARAESAVGRNIARCGR